MAKLTGELNSPRLHYAGRPSLLRKEGEKKLKLNPLSRSEERVVERSNDRVSKINDR
jgi:hypothetical protein